MERERGVQGGRVPGEGGGEGYRTKEDTEGGMKAFVRQTILPVTGS
jgi:hypothetical protein